MFRKLLLLTACAAVALSATPARANGDVNFSIGNRSIEGNDFSPVDQQPFMGVTGTFKMKDWPVDLAGGFYRSTKDDTIAGVGVRATLTEFSFGAMKTWDLAQNMHPFAGGGLSMVTVSAEVSTPLGSAHVSDNATALYMEGGVYWRFGQRFNAGVQARYNNASSVSLGGGQFDTNYFQIGVLAGFGWGK